MSKKETTSRMYLKLHGQVVWVDEMYTMESGLLRRFYEFEYVGEVSLIIKNSILEKALDFCKKRAEIRIQHKDDDEKLLLQDKLKDFDSDFVKQIKEKNDKDAIIIHLIDAACKLEIDRLLELLLDDAVDIITHKTSPEDVKTKIFHVHYNGDDRLFNEMKELLGIARWTLK